MAENPVPTTSTFKNGPVRVTATKKTSCQLVNGYTALHWAVENDDRDAVQLLLEAGADVNRVASFDAHAGVTPLHLAAQDGRTDVANDLLRHGATRDPRKSTRNRDNITPLHQAVYNSHPATVDALLAAGCDPNIQADNGYAAIHYAAQKGSVEMTKAIANTSACDVALRASTREQRDITPLHLAVQSGSVDVVLALAAAGAPVDAGKRMDGGVSGVTALHQAVYQEREEIAAALLELGADPLRSMDGWYTSLHVAAAKGCARIARRLVEATSERAVDTRASLGDQTDLTPLHVAAQHGHDEVIRVFVDAGADTSAVRGFGDRGAITALHLAAENGFVDAVVALLETTTPDGGDRSSLINAQDSLGFTALHLAVQYQFPDVVRVLVVAGIDVSLRTNDGLTAWRIACQQNDTSIMQTLGPEPPASALRTDEAISNSLYYKERKSNRLRSLLCGINKHV